MTHPTLKRAQALYQDRGPWESLWDVVYRYLAPERATIFRRGDERSPNEVSEEVFDSTGIDSAERLVNLIISDLVPPWQRWARFEPGENLNENDREQLRPFLKDAENKVFRVLTRSGFYEEIQPMLIDRVIGGTGGLGRFEINGELRYRCIPLSALAIEENFAGRLSCVVYKSEWTCEDIYRRYRDKLPDELKQMDEEQRRSTKKHVYVVSSLEADGLWKNETVLEHAGGVELESRTESSPQLRASRWSRIPGTAYGRGPGLRALSDVRALNTLKELTLKNAAKAVLGVYTAVNDGVLNPWTVTFQPGAVIPVAANDVQNPPLAELPNSTRFDVSQFSMGDLVQSIRRTFLADQFGDLQRTPRSATEISERARIVAQDLGASVARLQQEIISGVLLDVVGYLQRKGEIDPEMEIEGELADVRFTSRLAQAQRMADEQNIIEYANVVTQFGEVDNRAGLVLDVHSALRRLGQIKDIHPDDMRTEDAINQIMQQAAQAQAEAMQAQQAMQPPEGGQ